MAERDNSGDVHPLQTALKYGKMLTNLSGAKDNIAAKVFIYQEDKYVDAPYFRRSLSDLSFPKNDSREMHAESIPKKSPKSIPVVVLITSKHTQDILNTYYLQAHCCINETLNLK